MLARSRGLLVALAACATQVKPTRTVDGVKTTIVVDDRWPKDGYACPEAKPLPRALVGYIEDYARAKLCRLPCESQASVEVDPRTGLLKLHYAGEGDWYCIVLNGTPAGLVVTLKYDGGYEL